MSEGQAAIAVLWLARYLGLGALFAVVFLSFGMQRIDANARAASAGFRLLVLPGVLLLWPLLMWRWLRSRRHAQ